MPAPLLTWLPKVGPQAATSTIAGMLDAINTLVNANVAANPTTALWQVASYQSTALGYVVLKPTAAGITAGATSTARIIFFGGTTPNTAAIDGVTANSNGLYSGVAPLANVDVPDQSYAVGVPFTTGAYVSGGALALVVTTMDKVSYWENLDGIAMIVHNTGMSGVGGNLANGFAGKLAIDVDGETARWFCSGCHAVWTASNQDTIQSGVPTGQWLQGNTTFVAAGARANVLDETNTVIPTCRMTSPFVGYMSAANDGSKKLFFGVAMRGQLTPTTRFKMRQIAYGPQAIFGDIISDVSGPVAYKISASLSTAAADGPWLTNFRV